VEFAVKSMFVDGLAELVFDERVSPRLIRISSAEELP
jgi:hypothetical protein